MMKVRSRVRVSSVEQIVLLLSICAHQAACRQLIKPPVDIGDESRTKLTEYSNNANHFKTQTFAEIEIENGPPCSLDIQKDLPKSNDPQPLYINPATNQIWPPNKNGFLEVPKGATIELYCSSSFANSTTEDAERLIAQHTKTLKPTCLTGTTFAWRGVKFELRQFVCKKPVYYAVERTGAKCATAAEIYRVGFNVTEGRFIETMRICYDVDTMRNHYTHHRLLPGSLHFQRYVNRLNFSKAGFFERHNVNFYYTQRNQQQRALQLFGSNEKIKQIFNARDLYLARGHLAAKSDFVYANQQRSTFTFLNVAPQWQTFNSGQWAALENEVRRFVMKQQLAVDCYTGTWGTMELRPPSGKPQQFHLAKDANNNGILPVPRLYYRIIIDRSNWKRGIVLLGVNDPFATHADIQVTYIICENIAEQVPWLRWIRNQNLKKGFIYACSVEDFTRAVNILSLDFKNTTEILK